jgi:hypothetical protein
MKPGPIALPGSINLYQVIGWRSGVSSIALVLVGELKFLNGLRDAILIGAWTRTNLSH